MPPHLHPRSRSTISLFTLTLTSSLVIVGIPHLFPCPAPRRAYADSQMIMSADGQQRIARKRRRKAVDNESAEGAVTTTAMASESSQQNSLDEEIVRFRQMEEEARLLAEVKRECPVPKPGGVVGQLLGFKNQEKDEGRGRDGIPRADIPGREGGP
ncbi:hypothetical protein AJ79_09837 [Helicocarpus griseus UAMH5409]|uniref:Alpha-1,3-mannosyltransferase n=1 Tax=Helicocarpus griseus UAMH5409 TaxID=1447875 RepID=A0A2B7WGS1_9EURO|nr:hypothetical protein AJ79_09837 [Helicocarpus griseus UAMH5409]